jgi:hypothetical protein
VLPPTATLDARVFHRRGTPGRHRRPPAWCRRRLGRGVDRRLQKRGGCGRAVRQPAQLPMQLRSSRLRDDWRQARAQCSSQAPGGAPQLAASGARRSTVVPSAAAAPPQPGRTRPTRPRHRSDSPIRRRGAIVRYLESENSTKTEEGLGAIICGHIHLGSRKDRRCGGSGGCAARGAGRAAAHRHQGHHLARTQQRQCPPVSPSLKQRHPLPILWPWTTSAP